MPGFNDGFFDERSSFDPSDITIDDNTAPAFLIREGTNEYMRIDTTNGSELTQFKMPFTTGGFKYIQETSAGPYEFIKCDSTSVRLFPGLTGGGFNFSHITVGTGGIQLASNAELRIASGMPVSGSGARAYIITSGHSWTELLATGATSKIQRLDGFKMLEVDTDSNATFTLDDGSGAVFKVVNDAGSPKTFLSITDGGSTTIDSETATTIKAQGHQYLYMATSELQIGAVGKYNVIHHGTPIFYRSPSVVALGATSTTTIVNIQDDGPYKRFKLNPSTTSQTFTFEFQDGTSTNNAFVIEQSFVIQNYGTQNCTIQATVTSGRGSALGKDLSAGGSTSGELVAGMTLNAGKSAIFKAIKWNKEQAGTPTAADNEFMFQTIMVEA